MAKLLILIGSDYVAEYVGKEVFESAPTRVMVGSLTAANLDVNSPNRHCVRVIVNSRQSRYCTHGR